MRTGVSVASNKVTGLRVHPLLVWQSHEKASQSLAEVVAIVAATCHPHGRVSVRLASRHFPEGKTPSVAVRHHLPLPGCWLGQRLIKGVPPPFFT